MLPVSRTCLRGGYKEVGSRWLGNQFISYQSLTCWVVIQTGQLWKVRNWNYTIIHNYLSHSYAAMSFMFSRNTWNGSGFQRSVAFSCFDHVIPLMKCHWPFLFKAVKYQRFRCAWIGLTHGLPKICSLFHGTELSFMVPSSVLTRIKV